LPVVFWLPCNLFSRWHFFRLVTLPHISVILTDDRFKPPLTMNAPPDPRRVLKFGVFEVDLRKCELRRSGSRQKLGPQAFQVLEALLERPGELITREELRQQLWPASPFIDHELGLKKCVSRIREVLGDSADNPRFVETVPRCGYRFITPVEQIVALGAAAGAGVVQASITMAQIQSVDTPSMADVEIPPSAELRTRWRKGWSNQRKVWVLAALASAAFVSIWLGSANRIGSRMRAGGSNEQEVLPLTSVDGEQMLPAFSPDGSRVAFLRRASRRKESGIYLAVVGEQSLLKLTEDEDAYSPTWSPDGRRVAFLRDQGQNFLIQTVPALGGAAKTIYAGARAPLSYETGSGGLSFSPDAELLAFSELNAATQRASIKLLSLRDSTARFLTSPPPRSHDRRAAFSPTGDRVAFIRSSGPTSVEEVFLISAGGGEPRQLTFDHKLILGPPTWTRNREEIIFSSNRRGPAALWRISVAGGVPLRVPGAGPIATDPTASLSGKELAYEHTDEEENLWRLPLRDATHARPPASVVVSSAKSQNCYRNSRPTAARSRSSRSAQGIRRFGFTRATAQVRHRSQTSGVLPGVLVGRRMAVIWRLTTVRNCIPRSMLSKPEAAARMFWRQFPMQTTCCQAGREMENGFTSLRIVVQRDTRSGRWRSRMGQRCQRDRCRSRGMAGSGR
jgi:DNA-binding winged helix-turn-helix (wHTH) protein/Tol biopolymer transport system component